MFDNWEPLEPAVPDELYATGERCPDCGTAVVGIGCPACGLSDLEIAERLVGPL